MKATFNTILKIIYSSSIENNKIKISFFNTIQIKSIIDLFIKLDNKQKGYISLEDIKSFMLRNNYNVNDKIYKIYFYIYSENDKISINRFVEMLSPFDYELELKYKINDIFDENLQNLIICPYEIEEYFGKIINNEIQVIYKIDNYIKNHNQILCENLFINYEVFLREILNQFSIIELQVLKRIIFFFDKNKNSFIDSDDIYNFIVLFKREKNNKFIIISSRESLFKNLIKSHNHTLSYLIRRIILYQLEVESIKKLIFEKLSILEGIYHFEDIYLSLTDQDNLISKNSYKTNLYFNFYLFTTKYEIDLLFNIYDEDNDNKLNFSEFMKLFNSFTILKCSNEEKHSNKLSNSKRINEINLLISTYFEFLLLSEIKLNEIKLSVFHSNSSLYEEFIKIRSIENKNFCNVKSIKKYLLENSSYDTNFIIEENILLFIRKAKLNKYNDFSFIEELSFSDFFKALSPFIKN